MDKKSYHKSLVFIAACMAIFLFGMIMISLGTILPLLGDRMRLDEMSKGILATVLPSGILAGSLIFGPVTDRYGYRYLLAISAVITMACYLAIAYISAYSVLTAVIFFLGLSGGILNGTANALVSNMSEVASENKAANLSLMGVFFGVGALGLPFLIGIFIERFGFTSMLTGAGLFMILPFLLFILIGYPAPASTQRISLKSWFGYAATPLMFLVGMIGFFQSGLESLVNNWFTSYSTGVAGIGEKTALLSLTVYVAVFTFMRLALGFLLRKYDARIIMAVSMALVAAGPLILMVNSSRPALVIALVLFGTGLSATFPVITGHTGDLFRDFPGTAIGILFTFSLIGNMAINYSMGWITSATGMGGYPVIFLSTVVLACLFIFLFYRKAGQAGNKNEDTTKN